MPLAIKNQSPILNYQFKRVAMNIKKIIKELGQQEILGCFIYIQVQLNE